MPSLSGWATTAGVLPLFLAGLGWPPKPGTSASGRPAVHHAGECAEARGRDKRRGARPPTSASCRRTAVRRNPDLSHHVQERRGHSEGSADRFALPARGMASHETAFARWTMECDRLSGRRRGAESDPSPVLRQRRAGFASEHGDVARRDLLRCQSVRSIDGTAWHSNGDPRGSRCEGRTRSASRRRVHPGNASFCHDGGLPHQEGPQRSHEIVVRGHAGRSSASRSHCGAVGAALLAACSSDKIASVAICRLLSCVFYPIVRRLPVTARGSAESNGDRS